MTLDKLDLGDYNNSVEVGVSNSYKIPLFQYHPRQMSYLETAGFCIGQITMNCVCCGKTINKRSKACNRCATRIRTWGVDGTKWIYSLVQSNRNTSREELQRFLDKYYIGKRSDLYYVYYDLIKAITIAGYSGTIKNHPRKVIDTIEANRTRNNIAAYRMMIHIKKCERCGSRSTKLYNHHIVPIQLGGKSIRKNLIKLCKPCHLEVQRKASKLIIDHFENAFDFLYELLINTIK